MTYAEWYEQNYQYKDWYFEQYPFLKEFIFPIPEQTLKYFYVVDIQGRNLPVNQIILDNYDFLFSYFLDNYPKVKNKENRFTGKTWFEYFINAIPEGISNVTKNVPVISDLTDFLKNINTFFPIILILLALYLWKK